MGEDDGMRRAEALRRPARWLSLAATVGMFAVLVMGATVTNTGSAEGCGRSWPLCHGRFIPSFAVATAIEFSHRLVTSVESLLVFALAAVALLGWRRRREVQLLVPLMLFTLLLQAGLGAWAVMRPQQPLVLASHFGVSLTAFASVLLLAVFFRQEGGSEIRRNAPLPAHFRPVVFGAIAYVYLLVYLGAYVRHSGAALACGGWPLCAGQVFPGFSGPAGIEFMHRLAAVLGTLVVVGLAAWAARWRRRRPDLFRTAWLTLLLILVQSLSGALVVWTHLDLFSALSHAAIVTLLFGSLCVLAYQTLPLQQAAGETRRERPARLEVAPLDD